jgi:hypothetical protein
VVERGHAAREQVRMFVGQVAGDPETQVARGCRHQRDYIGRVVDRELHRFACRDVDAVAQHIIDAHDIGQKYMVEQAALEQLRQLGPVSGLVIVDRVVTRVLP